MVETEHRVRIPIAHPAPIRALGAGPGLIATAGGDGMIRTWAAGPGAYFPDGGSTRISFLGVAEAAGLLVVGELGGVRRFDLATGREIGLRLRAPGTAGLSFSGLGPVAVHAEGRDVLLVAGGSMNWGGIHRWDGLTGEPVGPAWAGHDARVLAVAVLRLSDGRRMIISAGDDDVVRRWDAVTGEPIGGALPGIIRYPVTELVCASGVDGRDVVLGQEYDGPIHRWDADTGEPVGRPLALGGPKASAGGLAVTPDGRVLWSLDEDGTPWRWDLTLPEPVAEPLVTRVGGVNHVAAVTTAEGFVFVTGCERGRLRRWDPAGRAAGDDLTGHPGRVDGLIALPPGPSGPDPTGGTPPRRGRPAVLVSKGLDGARCWDAATGRQVGEGPLPAGDGMAAAWLPDGRLILATGVEQGVLRCDVLAGTTEETDEEEGADGEPEVWDVAAGALPDGRQFFAGAGQSGVVGLIDAATGDALGEPLRGLKGAAFAVVVADLPDGTVMIAAGGADRRVLRWDAATGTRIGEPLAAGRYPVASLAYRLAPAGRPLLIAVDEAGRAWRWDARSGEQVGEALRVPGGVSGPTTLLAGTAPGGTIAVGRGERVHRWNADTGERLGDIAGATCATAVALPGGRVVLATGYADGRITVS